MSELTRNELLQLLGYEGHNEALIHGLARALLVCEECGRGNGANPACYSCGVSKEITLAEFEHRQGESRAQPSPGQDNGESDGK